MPVVPTPTVLHPAAHMHHLVVLEVLWRGRKGCVDGCEAERVCVGGWGTSLSCIGTQQNYFKLFSLILHCC